MRVVYFSDSKKTVLEISDDETILHLDGKSIARINFEDCDNSKLKHLELRNNELTYIGNITWPPKIEYLDLTYNKITYVNNIIWPQSLESLYLYCNEIIYIDSNWPQSLERLDLYDNKLTFIGNQNWPQDLHIWLTENPLVYVYPSSKKVSFNHQIITMKQLNERLESERKKG